MYTVPRDLFTFHPHAVYSVMYYKKYTHSSIGGMILLVLFHIFVTRQYLCHVVNASFKVNLVLGGLTGE